LIRHRTRQFAKSGCTHDHQCEPDRTPITKPSPTKYLETKARARFDKTPHGALNALSGPLKMTATMKRRAKETAEQAGFGAPRLSQ
jgi:hypothetical protein